MMTFHEFNFGMVVMDGKRCVAKARKRNLGWHLILEGASWIERSERKPIRDDWPKEVKSLWAHYPNMLLVQSKGEARKKLQELAKGPFK